MATRSNIAVQLDNGDVMSVYCHWDGYGHLPTLQQNYNSQELAEELVRMGDISSLGNCIDDTVFYGRDRNEKNVDPEILYRNQFASNTEYIVSKLFKNEYFYLFQNGEWKQFG